MSDWDIVRFALVDVDELVCLREVGGEPKVGGDAEEGSFGAVVGAESTLETFKKVICKVGFELVCTGMFKLGKEWKVPESSLISRAVWVQSSFVESRGDGGEPE